MNEQEIIQESVFIPDHVIAQGAEYIRGWIDGHSFAAAMPQIVAPWSRGSSFREWYDYAMDKYPASMRILSASAAWQVFGSHITVGYGRRAMLFQMLENAYLYGRRDGLEAEP